MNAHTRHGHIAITVRPTRAPDGTMRVLLQLPDGHVLVRPEDARTLAAMLDDAAVSANDEGQDDTSTLWTAI